MADQTLGQTRVRASFNPTNDSTVDQLKKMTADLIDLCESLKDTPALALEEMRCFEEAQMLFETAAMWAVKGATFDRWANKRQLTLTGVSALTPGGMGAPNGPGPIGAGASDEDK